MYCYRLLSFIPLTNNYHATFFDLATWTDNATRELIAAYYKYKDDFVNGKTKKTSLWNLIAHQMGEGFEASRVRFIVFLNIFFLGFKVNMDKQFS